MNALAPATNDSCATPLRATAGGASAMFWLAGAIAVALAAWLTRALPGWAMMWAIAGTEFFILKIATLRGCTHRISGWRIALYLAAWPGMNAPTFLPTGAEDRLPAPAAELTWTLLKLALGLALAGWAVLHVADSPPLLVGWLGMLGIIFALHFGLFHVVSWLWRSAGLHAPPIMRAPIAATSLAEFWGERWNVAFAEAARRFIMRPLARRHGARFAGFIVFALSGLVHETVISLPARGGWGGPMLYFLLHALGIVVEKSATGHRLGLGRGVRGWCWMFLFTVVPLPLLFHAPFVRNVIVPFYRSLAALLP